MAATEDLAKLVVKLEAQTAQYDENLKRAQKELRALRKSADEASKSAGFLTGAVKGFIAAFTVDRILAVAKATIDWADNLNDLSERVGVSTENLSRLSYAAKLSGSDLDSLKTGLVQLSKTTISGSNAEALQALGVSAKDATGELKKPIDLFFDIADAFSNVEDGAAKTAAAMAIFGKSGADLINVLNLGRKGLQDFGKESDKVGYTLDKVAAEKAAELNDQLDRLSLRAQAAAHSLVGYFTPSLISSIDRISEFADKLKDGVLDLRPFDVDLVVDINLEIRAVKLLNDSRSAIGRFALGVATDIAKALGAQVVDEASQNLENSTGRMAGTLEKLGQRGTTALDDLSQAWSEYKDNALASSDAAQEILRSTQAALDDSLKSVSRGAEKQKLLFDPEAQKAAAAAAKRNKDQIDAVIASLKKQAETAGFTARQLVQYELGTLRASSATKELADSYGRIIEQGEVDKLIADLQKQYETLGLNERELTAYELASRGASAADKERADNIEALIENQKSLQDAAQQFKDAAAAADDYLKTLSEKYAAPIAGVTDAQIELNKGLAEAEYLLNSNAVTFDGYKRIVDSLGETYKKATEQTELFGISTEDIGKRAAENVQDAFADFFENFGHGTKSIVSDFAIAMRKLAAQVAASQALKFLSQLAAGKAPAGGSGTPLDASGFILGAIDAYLGSGGGASSGFDIAAALGDIPGLAGGGRLRAGQLSIVGENGPELFAPDRSGAVVPDMASWGDSGYGNGEASIVIEDHVGVPVKARRMSDGEIRIMIGDAASQAVAAARSAVARDLGDLRSPASRALTETHRTTPRASRG